MDFATKEKTEARLSLAAFGPEHAIENSRLGLATSKTEPHRPPPSGNFNNALEIDPELRQKRVGVICFGDEITSTSNDRVKFATYTRDSYTGLDYADQRFYASTYGRFNSPDAYGASAHLANPMTWNRYMYVLGDPTNRRDPSGRDSCNGTDDGWDDNTYGCVDTSGGGYCPGGDGFADDGSPGCAYGNDGGGDVGGYGSGSGSSSAPDCNSLVASVGLAGLTYSNATEIWFDGNLNSYSTDATAAIIASLAAVTWQGESDFQLNPTNTPAGGGRVAVGPFQVLYPLHLSETNNPTGVFGTNLQPGQSFNGSPDSNIAFGIGILESLYNRFGNLAAGRYIGVDINGQHPEVPQRQQTFNQYAPALENLFGNTNCFPHQ